MKMGLTRETGNNIMDVVSGVFMEYRKIRKEEFTALRKIHSLVYFMKYDEEKTDTYPGADENRWTYGYGAFDKDGKIQAVLEAVPFESYLDGHIVGSPGIAGVATLLEKRRSGHVRKLLELAFNDMHEKGDVMSYLYPFSHDYYRKFGYSQACTGIVVTTDIENIVTSEHKGYTKQYFPEDKFNELKKVYDAFSSQFNCSVARKDWRWKREFSTNPYKSDTRVFIRYNMDNEPIAYLKMKTKEVAEYTYDMIVSECAWAGTEGLLGLISIINAYQGDLRKVKLELPAGTPVSLIVKEVWETEVRTRFTGMNRIMDATKALELIKKPEKPGGAVIELLDKNCRWNTGRWLVEWQDGKCSVEKTVHEPDIRCAAPEFSQLVIGKYSFDKMVELNTVDVLKNANILRELFIDKPCFIWDRF